VSILDWSFNVRFSVVDRLILMARSEGVDEDEEEGIPALEYPLRSALVAAVLLLLVRLGDLVVVV